MASNTGYLGRMRFARLFGRNRVARCSAGVALVAVSLLVTALPAVAATPSTLVVAIVGNGGVTSKPLGIACPGTCTATFRAGTSVVLTAQPRNGSTFLRWSGGSCTGTGACTVKVSTLTSVAAQFTAGPKARPQPVPTKSVAAPGSYTGDWANYGGNAVTFFVSPGGTSLLNISVPGVAIACTPAGSFPRSDHIGILKTTINPNGSFSATATQEGVFDNAKARFTYSFVGMFKGATSAGPPTAAGTLQEHIVFPANGTTETCTSNDQSWAVTHDPQPAPTKSVAAPGSYTGDWANYGGNAVTFFVSPGGTSLLNISVPGVGIACTPAGSFPGSDHISILDTPINPNGSFAAEGTQQGVFDGSNAKFTYYFAGHVEGATPSGTLTMAGTLREDIVFPANGTTESCTSNQQSWTVAHDPQPAPTNSAAVPGSYSGDWANYGGNAVTFSVSPGGRSLTDISVPGVGIACTPAGSFPGSDHIGILQTPIRPNGSFLAMATQRGVFDNLNAKFTYYFAGHVEGATPSGTLTMAGTLREDIVFPANGTTESCTSNDQSWSAIRT